MQLTFLHKLQPQPFPWNQEVLTCFQRQRIYNRKGKDKEKNNQDGKEKSLGTILFSFKDNENRKGNLQNILLECPTSPMISLCDL